MKRLNKVLTSLVIGGAILSTSIVAFAAESKTNSGKTTDKSRSQVSEKMMRGGDKSRSNLGKDVVKHDIENDLKTLVSAGIITQDESDKILALSNTNQVAETDKTKTDKDRNKNDIFTQAVSNGILTQEKADAAKASLQATHETEKNAKLTEGLNTLVTAGTITQAQADKVLAYVAILETTKLEPGTAPSADQKDKKTNPLSELVDNGTLTQAQLDEVSKVLPIGRGHGHGSHDGSGINKPAKATTDTTTSTISN
jgi:hypothetical protein